MGDSTADERAPDAAVSPPNETSRPATTVLDPDGDLLLHVGAELAGAKPSLLRVCSASMRRASPVWKAMLFGSFAEAKPTHGDWTVHLPDDNPETLRLFLDLIHGAFANVPQTVSLAYLCGILIVADKFDLCHLLKPFINSWAEVLKAKVVPGSDEEQGSLLSFTGSFHVQRLYAAWELGCNALVTKDVVHLIYNAAKVGTSLHSQGSLIEVGHHPGPPDLLEIVSKHRLTLIQPFLDCFHAEVDCRMPDTKIKGCIRVYSGYYTSAAQDSILCDAVTLGGFWQSLGTNTLPRRGEEYSGSAQDLIDRLSLMVMNLPVLTTEHASCRPIKKFYECDKQVKSIKPCHDPLVPHHVEQMGKNRLRYGMASTWIDAV